MDTGGILLALVAWALASAFGLVLCRMAGDQDREARLIEKDLIPHSDVTVTQFGI